MAKGEGRTDRIWKIKGEARMAMKDLETRTMMPLDASPKHDQDQTEPSSPSWVKMTEYSRQSIHQSKMVS